MSPAAIELLIALAKEGPAVLAFAEQTYALYKGGKLTAEELEAMWSKATVASKAAEDKWKAAKPAA